MDFDKTHVKLRRRFGIFQPNGVGIVAVVILNVHLQTIRD